MSNNMLLSICIPTYNREKCLRDAINSVLPQLNDGIELIISDNASSDNTKNVVKDFLDANSSKNIIYFRNDSNLGLDGNVLNLVNLAKGKYILFLGDDDLLIKGSLAYVSKFLAGNVAMIFLNWQHLSPDGSVPWRFSDMKKDLYFNDKDKFLGFLGCYVSFISATLINRTLVYEAIARYNLLRFIGKGQIHYYISLAISSIKPQNFDLIFASQLCVSRRPDPNQPWNIFNAFGTVVIELFKNIEEFGYDHKLTKKIINAILIDYVFMGAIVTICQAKVANDKLSVFFRNVYKENRGNVLFWLLVCPVFCIPKSVIRFFYRLYRKYRKEKKTCRVYARAVV